MDDRTIITLIFFCAAAKVGHWLGRRSGIRDGVSGGIGHAERMIHLALHGDPSDQPESFREMLRDHGWVDTGKSMCRARSEAAEAGHEQANG